MLWNKELREAKLLAWSDSFFRLWRASQQGAPLARWGRRATAYPRNGGARRAALRPDQGIRGGFSPCS